MQSTHTGDIWQCANGGTYNEPLYLHRINIVRRIVLQTEHQQLTLIRIFGLFLYFRSENKAVPRRPGWLRYYT